MYRRPDKGLPPLCIHLTGEKVFFQGRQQPLSASGRSSIPEGTLRAAEGECDYCDAAPLFPAATSFGGAGKKISREHYPQRFPVGKKPNV